MPRRNAGNTCGRRSASRDVPTGLNRLVSDALAQENICIEEVFEKLSKESVAVCGDSFLYSLKYAPVDAVRVVRRLEQIRRDAPMTTALLTPFDPYFPM
jgi:hypothetical protein